MPSTRPSSSRARRILVVEDDQGILELVRTVLQHEGYRVDTASTSQAALRKARARSYDLVILDLILPDADGVILLGKLKKFLPGLEGRTIFMTGFTSREPVLDYLRSRSAEFLQKPFRAEDLLDAVNKLA
jgi:two-component system, OmpR family, response regulator